MSIQLWLLSLGVLLLGPALLAWVQRAPLWLQTAGLQGLDGFVLTSVAGIVLADVLPHALGESGMWAVPLVLLGLIGPSLAEKGLHRAAERVHALALLLGMAGLVLHATLDGVALAGGDTHPQLAMAVLLHRLPEGLTIWWLLRPTYGKAIAALALGLVGAATVLGMWAGPTMVPDGMAIGLIEALVAGSLLHVVVHRPHPLVHLGQGPRGRLAGGFGGLLGAAVVILLLSHDPDGHDAHVAAVAASFEHLFLESAPALLLAYLAAGLVQAMLPAASTAWMRRGGALSQALRGVLFGLPLPICSCGVVPVYRSLVTRGVPAAAGLAFLVATPELGLDAIWLSWPLLGGRMTLARVVAAVLVAVGVGWLVGRNMPLTHEEQAQTAMPRKDGHAWPQRLWQGLKLGFGEIVDHTAPWLLLGLALAALAEPELQAGLLEHLPKGWDVPLFALLGMPLYVCASGATPLVAVLVGHGVSPGAGLAFLLMGPATNISTFGVLARLHGTPVALRFGAAMAVLSIAAGYACNLALGAYTVPLAAATEHGLVFWLEVTAAILLALLFGASVLRQGARGFFAQVLEFADGEGRSGHAGHAHAHSDDHGHAHSHAHDHAHAHDHGHGHAHDHHHPH